MAHKRPATYSLAGNTAPSIRQVSQRPRQALLDTHREVHPQGNRCGDEASTLVKIFPSTTHLGSGPE